MTASNSILEHLKEYADRNYMIAIAKEHGKQSTVLLTELVDAIKNIYERIPPEEIETTLIVCIPANGQLTNHDKVETVTNLIDIIRMEYIFYESTPIIIELKSNGEFILFRDETGDFDCSEVSKRGIVYQYSNRTEFFYINETQCEVPNVHPIFASLFSIPTFFHLEDAFVSYRARYITHSKCPIFSQVWYGGPTSDRLFLKAGPESDMRKSLWNFLSITFSEADVEEEHLVDDRHPVDISVRWMFTNRIALIEIKWLGKSMSDAGTITANYTDGRARDGAQQLADYIDWKYSNSEVQIIRGYLVVIDGRRKSLTPDMTTIGKDNGMHFRDIEIDYEDKDYHNTRHDFKNPIRMFAEPICRDY